MAKVIGQDIPCKHYDRYTSFLTPSHDHVLSKYKKVIKAYCRSTPRLKTSLAQLKVREAFKDSAKCWHDNKSENGWIPYQDGFRPYWYWKEGGIHYRLYPYQYFMHRTISPFYRSMHIPWCVNFDLQDTFISSAFPDGNFCRDMFLIARFDYGGVMCRFHIKRGVRDQEKEYLNIYCSEFISTPKGNTRLYVFSSWPYEWDEWKITYENQPQEYASLANLSFKGTGWYKFPVPLACQNVILRLWPEEYKYWDYFILGVFNSEEYPDFNQRPYFSYD